MSYATAADLALAMPPETLRQLASDDPMATAPQAAVIEADAVLTRLACDIARYRLWADRASDEVRRRYEDARRMLERVASGEVVLAQPGPDSPPPAAGTLAVMLKASHPAMRYHRAGRVFVRGVPQEVAVSHEDAERLLADAHLLVTRQEE